MSYHAGSLKQRVGNMYPVLLKCSAVTVQRTLFLEHRREETIKQPPNISAVQRCMQAVPVLQVPLGGTSGPCLRNSKAEKANSKTES